MAPQPDQQKSEKKDDDGSAPPPQQQEAQAIARAGSITGPFAIMRQLFEDLEQMWTGVRRPQRAHADLGQYIPQIEVAERDNKLLVKADLPGVAPDDVEVTLHDDALVIEGERHGERETHDRSMWRSERVYGAFRRVIPLPAGIDPNSVEARFDNGVLEITAALPQKHASGRKVNIQSEPKVQH
jgi:HSP20 family protein